MFKPIKKNCVICGQGAFSRGTAQGWFGRFRSGNFDRKSGLVDSHGVDTELNIYYQTFFIYLDKARQEYNGTNLFPKRLTAMMKSGSHTIMMRKFKKIIIIKEVSHHLYQSPTDAKEGDVTYLVILDRVRAL